MSVAIFRFNDDTLAWGDENKEIVFTMPVSSEAFYTRVWTRAIAETNVKLFQDGGEFTPEQVEIVLDELQRLKKWCEENLKGDDHFFYMYDRLEDFIRIIPEEAPKSKQKFYLF